MIEFVQRIDAGTWAVREMHYPVWQVDQTDPQGRVIVYRCAHNWGDGLRCDTRVWDQSQVRACFRLYQTSAPPPDSV